MALSGATQVEQNVELARTIAQAFAEGGPAAAERFFHTELEFHDPCGVGAGVYRGLDGMRQLYEDFSGAWEEFSFQLVELEPAPDGRVFMAARQRVKRKATSREIDRTIYFILAFRDDKLVRWDGWHLRAVARSAAGLGE